MEDTEAWRTPVRESGEGGEAGRVGGRRNQVVQKRGGGEVQQPTIGELYEVPNVQVHVMND